MKLRIFVFLLLVANGLFFVWTQGGLALWGLPAHAQSEPQYLQQQLKPEALSLVREGAARSATVADQGVQCLISPLLSEQNAPALEKLAGQLLPAGSWQSQPINTPGRWMIYMGRFPNQAALQRKEEELRRLRISSFDAPPAEYLPGFSLGSFGDYDQAQAAYKQIQGKGVRSAQLVTVTEPVNGVQIRIEAATAAMREQLAKMRPTLQGQDFTACAG